MAGLAGDAKEEVDALVRADAEEDVGRGRDVAEVADELLEREVRRRRVPVQIEPVKGGCRTRVSYLFKP